MFKHLFFLLFCIGLFESVHANLPPPYDTVELLPYDGFAGFYGNAKPLEEIMKKNQINTIVEVGVFLGTATRHMASMLPSSGKIYAVDHWKGNVENQAGQSAYHKAVPYLYQQFLSNVVHAGMTDKIIPLKMDSLDAAVYLADPAKQLNIDLIYIDASHDTASVLADLKAWYPLVKGHGILCGDDWGWPSVRAAVIPFARENNLEIYNNGDNFWRYIE